MVLEETSLLNSSIIFVQRGNEARETKLGFRALCLCEPRKPLAVAVWGVWLQG